jgi:hypothetical protein
LRDIFLVRAFYWITALENTAGNIPSLVKRLHAYANTIKPFAPEHLDWVARRGLKEHPFIVELAGTGFGDTSTSHP